MCQNRQNVVKQGKVVNQFCQHLYRLVQSKRPESRKKQKALCKFNSGCEFRFCPSLLSLNIFCQV